MYLLPAGMNARSVTKWNLSGFRLRKGLDIAGTYPSTKQRVMRMNGLRGLRGLGDSISPDQLDLTPPNILDSGIILPPTVVPGTYDPFQYDKPNTQTPAVQPGVNPTTQSSIAQAYKQISQSAVVSQDPLDYVSPQAAIAAGVPAQTAYNAWSGAIARFPTQQAALAAGIPAGVVTQLWAQSRTAVPASTSFFSGTTLGLPNTLLLFGAGGIALLAFARGRH